MDCHAEPPRNMNWEPHSDPDRGWSGIRCRSPGSGAFSPGRHAAPRISRSPPRNTVLAASAERADTDTAVIREKIRRTPTRPVEIGRPGGLPVAPILPTCPRERSACRLRGSSRRSTRLRHFASGKLNRRIRADTRVPQHQHAPSFAANAPPLSAHPKDAARPRFRAMSRRSLEESRPAAQLSNQRAPRLALHSASAYNALHCRVEHVLVDSAGPPRRRVLCSADLDAACPKDGVCGSKPVAVRPKPTKLPWDNVVRLSQLGVVGLVQIRSRPARMVRAAPDRRIPISGR